MVDLIVALDGGVCSSCGFPCGDPAPHDDGYGRPVCDRCWSMPCLWFPNRPDCITFAEKVMAGRMRAKKDMGRWGLSDLRVKGVD